MTRSRYVRAPRGALAHLRRNDPELGRAMRRIGPFRLRRTAGRSHYELLVRAIVYQQISGRAARAIYGRLLSLGGGAVPRAEEMLALDETTLRGVGLSRHKAASLRDLAQRVASGELNLRRLARLDDAEVVGQLTRVRGIGVWTAQMFLIFRLGRLDVVPLDDLGVRKGLGVLAGAGRPASRDELRSRSELWRPFRTVACWYLWRLTDSENVGGW